MSALHDTILQGDVSAMKSLLDIDNSELNSKDDNGFTPIVLAASLGQEEMVELLALAGADVLQESPDGIPIKSLLEKWQENRKAHGEFVDLTTLAEETYLFSSLGSDYTDKR